MTLSADYLTEEQICEALGIARSTLRNRISKGTNHPPAIPLGRRYIFNRVQFTKWLEAKTMRELRHG